MKKIVLLAIGIFAAAVMASSREVPITFDQLPSAAKTFVTENFPGETVTMALKDVHGRAEYDVRLSDGTELEFTHSGALKKISSRAGVSEKFIPDSIRRYVTSLFPGAGYREYEVGRRTYEVKLSNGMELKFNSNFMVMEVDD